MRHLLIYTSVQLIFKLAYLFVFIVFIYVLAVTLKLPLAAVLLAR
jgi:hypothetical protein